MQHTCSRHAAGDPHISRHLFTCFQSKKREGLAAARFAHNETPTPLEPYRGPMPRVLRGSQGAGRLLMGEVPLYLFPVEEERGAGSSEVLGVDNRLILMVRPCTSRKSFKAKS